MLINFQNSFTGRLSGKFATKLYLKFAIEAYKDATSAPYGYLLIDLKPEQDEQCRLRTNVFPGETEFVYVRK